MAIQLARQRRSKSDLASNVRVVRSVITPALDRAELRPKTADNRHPMNGSADATYRRVRYFKVLGKQRSPGLHGCAVEKGARRERLGSILLTFVSEHLPGTIAVPAPA